MDPSVRREMRCRQAATMVVVMVSFVTTRLKRKRSGPDTEPDPLVYALRDEADQHRQQTLNVGGMTLDTHGRLHGLRYQGWSSP